jgi:ligand-binding sensor domain-containing protein
MIAKGKLLLAICLLCLGFTPMNAQSPAFFRYGNTSGLPCEEIYDLHQDRFGFLWIASDRGVYRFDGYTFRSFTTAQGLSDNTVFRLFEDKGGRMWLMPFSGDLCYIEKDIVHQYLYNDTLKKYLPGMRIIRSMEITEDGVLRIGYLLHGIVEISSNGNLHRVPLANAACSRLCFIHETESNSLVMGSQGFPFAPGLGSGILIKTQKSERVIALENQPMRDHIVGLIRRNGTLAFGVGTAWFEIDAQGVLQESNIPSTALCVMEDEQNCLWIGTDGGGILKYIPGANVHNSRPEIYYPNEAVTCILEDKEGAIWISTHHNGLLYVPNASVRAWGLFENDEACALTDGEDSTMYILWRDHGLTSITKGQQQHYSIDQEGACFKSLSWNATRDMLLIGTTGGSYSVDPEFRGVTKTIQSASNSIACVGKKTYFGFSWNLRCVDSAGNAYTVGSEFVRHRPDVLLAGVDGTLWVGALDGLYNVKDTSLVSWAGKHDLFTRRIAGMCQLEDSTLIVATQANGIAFVKGNTIRTLTQADNFPCDHVHGITRGKNGTVWCSAQSGLYEIDTRTTPISFRQSPAVQTVLRHSGKPWFQRSTGLLWICDGNRVISFDPELTRQSKTFPPVYISNVWIHDTLYTPSDRVEVSHYANNVRIEFCGIAYRMQGNISYRYRLRPTDDWTETKQHILEFAALEPDEYIFEVQAQNENGLWPSESATFSFTIVPAFWNTWWFLVVIFLISGVLIYWFFVIRFRIIRRRDLLREQALIFRQQALASQMNPHFVFNTLNTIQALVLKEEKTKALDMFSTFASLLRKSLQHSTERFISLEEELRILNLYFELEEMRFDGNLSYQIVLGKNVNPAALSVPAMLIQPLIENALVHGLKRNQGGGEVEVRFSFENDVLVVEVEDNGIGRVASALVKKQHSSSGTRITRDRLRVLGQMTGKNYPFEIVDKTDLESGAALGTIVRLALPYTMKEPNTYDEKTESIVSR